jgi:hypothetical protein
MKMRRFKRKRKSNLSKLREHTKIGLRNKEVLRQTRFLRHHTVWRLSSTHKVLRKPHDLPRQAVH